MSDSTSRFSNRVEHYVRWRPSYPDGVVTELVRACGLDRDWKIADVGSGPGNLARLFLDFGAAVIGVEPNREMREAGDRLLSSQTTFRSVDGTAEATTLPDASVDLVTAGQAFHWFDVSKARREFARILRGDRWVALIWNDRPAAATPFLVDYEALLRRRSPEYLAVRHQDRVNDEIIETFFTPSGFHRVSLPYEQVLDFAGIRGRLLSSSYAPAEGEPGHETMLAELDRIFYRHQDAGVVHFLYDTRVYVGRLIG